MLALLTYLDNLCHANSEYPEFCVEVSAVKQKIIEMMLSEQCLICSGFGHEAGKKCPTLKIILNIFSRLAPIGTDKIFADIIRKKISEHKRLQKIALEIQLQHKRNLEGIQMQKIFKDQRIKKQNAQYENFTNQMNINQKRKLNQSYNIELEQSFKKVKTLQSN
ncbi:unnamed protein product [Paramecium sonneborni]|uniref:Uncharacterized protein n=1 Tax=Paramecium sonneborni TaxID=65129 RepID=A0A8S1QLB9_9CILI|nr:unnamed protein product [Paramecium sonneborni]